MSQYIQQLFGCLCIYPGTRDAVRGELHIVVSSLVNWPAKPRKVVTWVQLNWGFFKNRWSRKLFTICSSYFTLSNRLAQVSRALLFQSVGQLLLTWPSSDHPDLDLNFNLMGSSPLFFSGCLPSSAGVGNAEMKSHLVHTWESGQISHEIMVLTNMRRVGMLSDCTKGFL